MISQRIRHLNPPVPIVTVLPSREYENWLIASATTICGRDLGGRPGLATNCQPPADPESISNPKRWLTERMPAGRAYKETEDQAPMTRWLDHQQVISTCRSFRRFHQAVQELVSAIDSAAVVITP
jgi:hypothetical protein